MAERLIFWELVQELGDPFSPFTSPQPVTPAEPAPATQELPAISGWPKVTDEPPRPEGHETGVMNALGFIPESELPPRRP